MAWVGEHPDGAVAAVLVVPGASRSEIVGRHGEALRVRVAAPAEAGKANRELERLFKAATGCRSIVILRGETGREKIVLLRGITVEEAESGLLGGSP